MRQKYIKQKEKATGNVNFIKIYTYIIMKYEKKK